MKNDPKNDGFLLADWWEIARPGRTSGSQTFKAPGDIKPFTDWDYPW